MLKKLKQSWVEPLEIIGNIPGKYWCLYYSGVKEEHTGNTSILCFDPIEQIKSDNFSEIEKKLSANKNKFENAWFGYLGYGLKNQLESLPKNSNKYLTFPDLWLIKFKNIIVFQHDKKTIHSNSKNLPKDLFKKSSAKKLAIKIENLSSNMTAGYYKKSVAKIREHIKAGDIYQANLTRKFYGKFKSQPDAINIYKNLCKASPAPYSCIFRLDDSYLLSSSPEQFIKLDEKGNVETRPIKGSAPKSSDKSKLAKSEKERAENLMIVDLMRNDLSRSCEYASVKVKNLFKITSYSTIHQMSSTIMGRKRKDESTIKLIKNCFPPGSMTGTPKIKAVEICSKLEGWKRGVYSGCLGWFGGDGSCDLSVIIRTLLIQKNKFEFQVGSGIVHDSIPTKELNETYDKAAGIIQALNIKKAELTKL